MSEILLFFERTVMTVRDEDKVKIQPASSCLGQKCVKRTVPLTHYLFLNSGALFSRNAAVPSFMSSDEKDSPKELTSSSDADFMSIS